MSKLKRTQIYIDEQDALDLSKEGKKKDCSVSQLIREAIKAYLFQQQRNNRSWEKDPLIKLVGKFTSKEKGLSEDIDKVLYDKTTK